MSDSEISDADGCDRALPEGLTLARTTPTWTRETVPPALLKLHHTSVWAELVVEAGMVDFHEFREDGDPWHTIGTVDRRVVIIPEQRHRIVPSSDARFHVEFYED